jgi:hypothetical protein
MLSATAVFAVETCFAAIAIDLVPDECFVTGARAIGRCAHIPRAGGAFAASKCFLKPGLASPAAVASNNQLGSAGWDRGAAEGP